MRKIFFLFLILYSYQVVGNEIICTNQINIFNPAVDEYGAVIGYPNLEKGISLSSKGHISEYDNSFGDAYKERILIDQTSSNIKMYFKTFSHEKWGKPIIKKFKILIDDNNYYFLEIKNDSEYEKEFFAIIKSINIYTRSYIWPGHEFITRGECTGH